MIGSGLVFAGINTFYFFKGNSISYEPKIQAANTEAANKNDTEPAAEKEESAVQLPVNEDESILKKKRPPSIYKKQPKIGEQVGELYIPKLNATFPIFHGSNEDELAQGVGHFAGSVLPGEQDNSVLAGHNDTVFRNLDKVGENDLLIVTTSAGEFTYKVKKVRIVDKDDRTVIVPKPRPTLTLVTCYPFNMLGDAPERYILVAELKTK